MTNNQLIIDSHCHAWAYWPYDPPVPNGDTRGNVELLINEMDVNGVAQALIVCAQIEHNPENNAYVAEQIPRYPDRLHMAADVDCSWSDTYHLPGAADRLRKAAERWPLKAFTHYLRGDDDASWFYSDEGLAFFQVAREKKLIASIAGGPQHWAALRVIAERFPDVTFLLHHLAGGKAAQPENLQEILACEPFPNIYIKLSGFHYATVSGKWDYPYLDSREVVRAEYEHFGPRRMCWGSDYPVVTLFMTHRQSLEAFRSHCDFVSAEDQAWILGKNLDGLLKAAGAS